MPHVRQSIRDNIVSTLTGLATTQTRVFRSRLYPMDSGKLPGLCIYTKSESSEFATMGSNRTVSRTMRVAVEIYVSGLTNYDNSLDAIAAQIEIALMTDRTRAGLAKDTRIVGFDADYSGDGERPVATGTIEVEVLYHTKEATPEAAV
jgi:hypothetical protein